MDGGTLVLDDYEVDEDSDDVVDQLEPVSPHASFPSSSAPLHPLPC